MTSRQLLDSLHPAVEEVSRRLASGELSGSGRFYTAEELAARAATGRPHKPQDSTEAPAT